MINDVDKERHVDNNEVDHFRTQWLACLTVCLAPLTTGLANGWSSPYLAQLSSPEAEAAIRLTDSETSWAASLLNLGRAVGATIGALIQVYIGRKQSLLLSGLVLVAGWICIVLATSVTWLYVSRICSGIGSGIMWTSLALYLGEIANPKIRGCLISWNVNTSLVGIFLGNVMGPYLSMQVFAYVSLVPNTLFLILFSLIPESPHHYILRGDIARAEKSLTWLRRKTDVKKELRELQEYTHTSKSSFLERIGEFKMLGHRRSLMILFCLNLFSYISGNNPMSSYMEIIVTKSKVNLTPSTVVMVLSFCTIVAGFTATFLIDVFGRRQLLIVSGIGVSAALFVLGLHFHLLSLGFEGRNFSWLPLSSLFIFLVSYNYGLGSIPTTLVGEMFPQSLKVIASFTFSSSSALFAFLSALTFQPFHAAIGESYAYWICAVAVSMSLPFTYFFVRETKGKSLLEIQKSLTKE